jgi:hypothetical protein
MPWPPCRGHFFGRVFDGAGQIVRRTIAARAAASHMDRGTAFAEDQRNAASSAAVAGR